MLPLARSNSCHVVEDSWVVQLYVEEEKSAVVWSWLKSASNLEDCTAASTYPAGIDICGASSRSSNYSPEMSRQPLVVVVLVISQCSYSVVMA